MTDDRSVMQNCTLEMLKAQWQREAAVEALCAISEVSFAMGWCKRQGMPCEGLRVNCCGNQVARCAVLIEHVRDVLVEGGSDV